MPTSSSDQTFKLAFLGPYGTYTHESAIRFTNLLTEESQAKLENTPISTIHECLEAVVAGDVDIALIPIENSTNGSVVLACDSLRDLVHNEDINDKDDIYTLSSKPENTRSESSSSYSSVRNSPALSPISPLAQTKNLAIINEIFVPIQHCLISFAPSLDQVSKLYTHPQAWGQVTNFTDREFPVSQGIPRIDANSTSGAVAIVAKEMADRKSRPDGQESGSYPAAIASAAAAKVHSVPILVPNISNVSTNTTRFLVFVRKNFPTDALTYKPETIEKLTSHPEGLSSASGPSRSGSPGGRADYVTLMSITVKHTEPGALCSCLQAFASRGINLTSINSRPAYNPAFKYRKLPANESGKPTVDVFNWQYVLFIEFYGNIYDDLKVQEAIKEIKKSSERLTVLGSFPRAPEYYGYKQ